ncbi:MAG: carbohydrate ABC transporter permease [Xanthobacteraceae bacterium]|nr:carbohydrate ABC transporter permease [Xanthobacteraceae bacterium]
MTRSERFVIVGRNFALTLVACIILVPLLWVMISSFRPAADIFQHSPQLSLQTFVPKTIVFDNYAHLLRGTSFDRWQIRSSSPSARWPSASRSARPRGSLSRSSISPFKRTLFVLTIVTFMMPFEAIVIPLYVMVRSLSWNDTFYALIMPEVSSGLVIFLFRQFFGKLNKELFEAARVDGASWPRIFFEVALPLSWPTVVAGGLMMFIHQWDAFFWPLVAATKTELTMVQVAIARYQQFEQSDFGRLFAAITVASLVAIIPFMALQRHYVRTIIDSGFK